MGLFNRHDSTMISGGLAPQRQTPKPVQEIKMVLEYFDNSQETISLTYNLEELQQQVSTSFGTDSSMNFTSAIPPFSINPRWVKKITYKAKGGDSI
ncbi:thiopurine S-methyltransferase [Streptococcus iniae]|nr:thiopurine S-methyltransferase [Streptococcus iniae]